ncbi:MAG: hypothetical protein QXH17_08210 [Candidatus Bathyarchaeia archaeon]
MPKNDDDKKTCRPGSNIIRKGSSLFYSFPSLLVILEKIFFILLLSSEKELNHKNFKGQIFFIEIANELVSENEL